MDEDTEDKDESDCFSCLLMKLGPKDSLSFEMISEIEKDEIELVIWQVGVEFEVKFDVTETII